MSEEQLKAFIAKAKDDQSIQEQLKAAKTSEDVLDVAKEHGHEFTTEHMTQLSEEELEGVAGGVCDPKSRKSGAITAEAISILIGCRWF